MRKKVNIIPLGILTIIAVLHQTPAIASIIGQNTLDLDFVNDTAIATKVRWDNQQPSNQKLTLNKDGLSYDGEKNTMVNVKIETLQPFAIGISWRPTSFATIEVEILPPRQRYATPGNSRYLPPPGNLFVRYSPDTKHWSSWQLIESVSTDNKDSAPWKFRGQIGIPQKDYQPYLDLLYEYQRLDVPWKSDEEAAVKWILKRDPRFFAKQIPFMGYLQFLFETSLYGGQNIKSIKINATYGVSGLHIPPTDEKVRKDRENIPWRFRAE